MLELLIFILTCYGMTSILVSGSIFDRIRPKYKFFHCSQCIGFWVGIVIFILFWFFDTFLFPNIYAGAFIYGCLSSGTSYLLDKVVGDDGIRFEKLITER